MLGKQAKILSPLDVADLLAFADCTRHPIRNRVIVLLSAKAGLRAGEIANLTWDMVVDASGQIGNVIELRDHAAKKGSGRLIPIHPDLVDALSAWRAGFRWIKPCSSVRAGRPDDCAQHRRLVQQGVSSSMPGGLLVSLGTADIHYPSSPARPQGRRVTARRSTVGRASVDPNNPAIHRRRH